MAHRCGTQFLAKSLNSVSQNHCSVIGGC
jgi:hypothetical protein